MQRDLAKATASDIAAWFDNYFRSLESLGDRMLPVLAPAFADDTNATITAKMSSQLREFVADFLKARPDADGAGIIFDLDLLSPNRRTLEWWERAEGQVRRTQFDLDPSSDWFYDYTKLDWFRGAFFGEHRTIAGPYIDYLGVDFYISTLSVPAYINNRKVGVISSDMRMTVLENKLLHLLKPLNRGAAVLSHHKQVVVGNSAQITTGVLVSMLPEGFDTISIPSEGLNLTLLYRK